MTLSVLNVMMGKGPGGLERAVVRFHEALVAAGCSVTSLVQPNAAVRKEFAEAADVVTFADLFAFDPSARWRLAVALKGRTFNVILAHGNHAIRLARTLREHAPLVAVCHTTNFNVARRLADIDGALTLTGAYRQALIVSGFPAERIRQAPNAIALGPPPGPPPPRETPLIGGLGRLVEDKGFDLLLEAAALLKTRGVRFEIVVHGVDERGGVASMEALRDRLGLARDQVSFPGWTASPDAFLRSLDVFCLPSRRETLSLALLEALAAGRPIVAARLKGLEEVVEDGLEALTFEVGDVAGLAAALERLIGDPALRLTMGQAARARAASFDLSVVGALYRQALVELIALARA